MTGPVPLTDARDPERVGGKAAGLARLLAGGHLVPDGVVLPADLLDGWDPADDAPGEVASAIADAVGTLGAGPFAVRSSAVGEDGAAASYAGVLDSVLSVPASDVEAAVRRCLTASRGERARAYASGGPPRMAVVVQRMVAPLVAGVAFSADPVTGDRDRVRISAVDGLADRLVAGEVDGDAWVVSDEEASGPLAERVSGPAVLDEETALLIAAEVRRVEATWGRPVDVEWALTGERLWLVQARPITALPTPPAATLPGTGWEKDAAHYPEPLTPFGESVYLPVFERSTRHMCDTYGLLVETVEGRAIGGEVYIRVVPAIGPADSKGRAAPPPILLGLLARLLPPLRRRVRRAEEAIAAGRLTGAFDDWDRRWRREFVDAEDRLLDVDPASLDDDGLVRHLDDRRQVLERGGRTHMELFLPYAVALHELVELCRDRLGWDEARTLDLLAGLSRASTSGRDDLAGIAADLADRPDALASLRTAPSRPVAALHEVAPELGERLTAWFRSHAWRTTNYDPGSTALAERPDLVTRLLLDGVRASDDGARVRAAAEEAARDRLHAEELGDLDRVLAAARRAYPIREDNVLLTDNVPCGLLRRWLLEASRRLVDRGLLARVEDGAFLTADELVAGLRGSVSEPDLRDAAQWRRREQAWVRAHPGPLHVGEPDALPDVSRLPAAARRLNAALLWMVGQEYPPERSAAATDALATGAAGSPGTYTGPVRVVLSEDDFARVRPGDVLVCPVTTPAWTLLFSTAGALVTDAGGVLSHAAIVAREHGIPAVLGTGDLTRRLVDGDVVTVDGTAGTVVRG